MSIFADGAEETPPNRNRDGRLVDFFLICFASLTLISYLGEVSWSFELLSNFRFQFFAASVVICILLLIVRRPIRAAALGFVTLLNFLPIQPYLRDDGRAEAQGGAPASIKVMTQNLRHEYADHAAFLALVRETDPDILVITEVGTARQQRLMSDLSRYPFVASTGGMSAFDVHLFSRHPLEAIYLPELSSMAFPALSLRTCARRERICTQIIALHAPRPGLPENTDNRNRMLKSVAKAAARARESLIVVGDLNVTPWSPVFNELLTTGQLEDAARGFGVRGTWLSRSPFFGLAIDHVLSNGRLSVLDYRVGPDIGSDHFAVIAELGHRFGP